MLGDVARVLAETYLTLPRRQRFVVGVFAEFLAKIGVKIFVAHACIVEIKIKLPEGNERDEDIAARSVQIIACVAWPHLVAEGFFVDDCSLEEAIKAASGYGSVRRG